MPTFYPRLFALVAAMLETFGTMVFDRILDRAEDAGEDVVVGRPAQASGGGTSISEKLNVRAEVTCTNLAGCSHKPGSKHC